MKAEFSLCMVGCGEFARLCHGPAQVRAARSGGLSLAGCCDPDGGRAERYRGQFGYARAYTDALHMLDSEKPDAVVLAVPPSVTCEAALPLLARGIPLLAEKPPGMSSAELDSLREAADAGGAPVQVGFNRRAMPVMRRALGLLEDSFPPDAVSRIDCDMVRCNRWNEDFSTTAIHAVDALLFLARAPFRAAELRHQPQHEEGRSARNVVLEASMASGTRLGLHVQPVGGRNAESIRIHGLGRSLWIQVPASPLSPEAGSLELWMDGRLAESYSDSGLEMVERMGILGELEDFIEGVRTGRPLAPSLSQCAQQVTIMEAMRNGQTGPIEFNGISAHN